MSATYAKAVRGQDHYRSKLTDDDVRALRQIASDRRALLAQLAALSNRALAEKFNVTPACVERVIYGQTWSHIA